MPKKREIRFGPHILEYDEEGNRVSQKRRELLDDGKKWKLTKDGWRRIKKEK